MRSRDARRAVRGGTALLAALAAAGTVTAGAVAISDDAESGGGAPAVSAPATAPAAAPAGPRAKAHVTFFRAPSAESLRAATDAVVVARVVSVGDGPAWISDDPRASTRPTDLTTRDVRLQVERRVRGEIPDDPIWSVVLAPGGFEVEHAETPKPGDRLLLFLKEHPRMPGRWIAPAIDGRVAIGARGVARAPFDNGVGHQLARELNAGGVAGLREAIR